MIARTSVSRRAPPQARNDGDSQAKTVMRADTTGDGPWRSLAMGRMGVNGVGVLPILTCGLNGTTIMQSRCWCNSAEDLPRTLQRSRRPDFPLGASSIKLQGVPQLNNNADPVTHKTGPVAKWAIRFGAAGFFGGLMMGVSQGGGLAFAVGMAIPAGLFASLVGAIIGLFIKVVGK